MNTWHNALSESLQLSCLLVTSERYLLETIAILLELEVSSSERVNRRQRVDTRLMSSRQHCENRALSPRDPGCGLSSGQLYFDVAEQQGESQRSYDTCACLINSLVTCHTSSGGIPTTHKSCLFLDVLLQD